MKFAGLFDKFLDNYGEKCKNLEISEKVSLFWSTKNNTIVDECESLDLNRLATKLIENWSST